MEELELTIFNESITEAALQEFQEQASKLPDTITDKSGYVLIKRHHIDAKNLRVAIGHRVDDLIGAAKEIFTNEKQFIINKQDDILGIITPIEAKLKQTRETYESSEKLKKEEAAHEIAERQKAEFERQEILRVWETAHIENSDYDQRKLDDLGRKKKDDELKQREEELERKEKAMEERQNKMLEEQFVKTAKENAPILSKQLDKDLNELAKEQEKQVIEDIDEYKKEEPAVFPDKPGNGTMKNLCDKYTVTKKDGPTDPNAVYFVLRIDKDPYAREALVAYASSINFVNRSLANDCRLLAFQHGYRE